MSPLGCAFLAAISFVVLMILLPLTQDIRFGLKQQNGIALFRRDTDHIWLTWNMESGVIISPHAALRWYGRAAFIHVEPWEPPEYFLQGPYKNAWSMDFSRYGGSPGTYASIVNPKLIQAEEKIHQILDLAKADEPDLESITRIAAESYIFLGWIVRDESRTQALRDFVNDNWENIDREADIETPSETFYRIVPGVERHFATDPDDPEELAHIRSEIPVFFERVNRAAGHPADEMHVLYLDGHIEAIPYGTKFPATDAFHQALYPEER